MLKEVRVMQMADISDDLPKMSFLPVNVLEKLSTFSTSNIDNMKMLFNISKDDVHVKKTF